MQPVLNWRGRIEETDVFRDSRDVGLRHFAPRATWRPLRRSDVGTKAIYAGELDFGYTPVEMQRLQAALPGIRLTPLIGNTTMNVVIDVVVPPPHLSRLTPLFGLPFATLRFTATIDTAVADGPELAAEIEQRWADMSLLAGDVTHRFDSVEAHGGYAVQVNFKACATALWAETGPVRTTATAAWEATSASVKHYADWIMYEGGDEQAGERETAEMVLTAALVTGCWESAGKLELYDNGFGLDALRIREPGTLHGPEERHFVRTEARQGELALFSSGPLPAVFVDDPDARGRTLARA